MTEETPTHPDLDSGARAIRSSGLTDIPMITAESAPDFALFRASTNLCDTALDVIRPIVIGDNAIIVTGYENLMSVLAMVMSLRPGLTFAERSALRILLTEQRRPMGRVAHAAGLTAGRLKAHFLRPDGVYIADPRDLRAIGAREALASGAIRIRIVNPGKLVRQGKHGPEGVQANMIVGEDFAALSTAGFSRRDLLDRAVMIDRVASEGQAFAARRDAAGAFWAAGDPCNREVTDILNSMLKPVDMPDAVAAAVRVTRGYGPFDGSACNRHPVQADLVSQALARVYENGFAFVSAPAGAGQAEIQEEITRRLEGNAARMIGGGEDNPGRWSAHVETATGAKWSERKICETLGSKAPLVLDGSVAPLGDETPAQAIYRRLKCRHLPRGTMQAMSDFEGFPKIRTETIEISATKGQGAAFVALQDEIERASEGALDDVSLEELRRLKRLAEQSSEAALFAWREGGMSAKVRTTAKGMGSARGADQDQNILPMFMGSDAQDEGVEDVIGNALAARAFRGIDKARLKAILEISGHRGQILCLVEDDLARHALARKMTEMSEMPVLAVIGEAAMRENGIGVRDASYQRAENAEVAMSMLAGNEAGTVAVFASADQAAQISLPAAAAAVAISVPDDVDRVAAGLSCIDGLGKKADSISCIVIEDGLERGRIGDVLTSPGRIVSNAATQMRMATAEARDGVADIMADLQSRLDEDAEASEGGRLNIAVLDSKEAFSIFVVAGTSQEADKAAMAPRILAICRNPATGEEIVRRNQVGCAELLARIEWPAPVEDPRVKPRLPDMDTIDVIGRHLSHLTHWDARPERLVALLEHLARFVGGERATGEELLSDLCLVSLELIAQRWSQHLMQSRKLAGVTNPGLDLAVEALTERPVWEVDEIREEMMRLIDRRLVEDAARSKTLHERVIAVIHGTGEAGLSM